MKVHVRLFGTLGDGFPRHDPLHGFEVEVANGATVKHLIDHLEIPRKKVGVISVNNRLVKPYHTLQEGDLVRVYRPIFGG